VNAEKIRHGVETMLRQTEAAAVRGGNEISRLGRLD